jgi:hypothetical protein
LTHTHRKQQVAYGEEVGIRSGAKQRVGEAYIDRQRQRQREVQGTVGVLNRFTYST